MSKTSPKFIQQLASLLLVTAFLFSSVAFASDMRVPTKQEEAIVASKFTAIKATKNPKDADNLVKELERYPFVMVLKFALKSLEEEIKKERANSYLIISYLGIIESMGSKADALRLTEIYKLFEKSAVSTSAPKRLQAAFESASQAISERNPVNLPGMSDEEAYFEDLLKKEASETSKNPNAKKAESAEILLKTISHYKTDDTKKAIEKGNLIEMIGRDKETSRALDVLVRLKGKNPMFIGLPGVGKTASSDRIAQMIIERTYPDTEVYRNAFENAVVIQVTPSRISRLAKSNDPNSMMAAVEMFFNSVLVFEDEFKKEGNPRPIHIFVDEFHTFTEAQVEALLPYMDSKDRGINIYGASNSDKFQMKFKDNEALMRRIEQIGLEEFDVPTTITILKKSWIPVIEKTYNVKFSDEAIETAVKVAPFVQPDTRRPDGPFKVLQDVAIGIHRATEGAANNVSDEMIYEHAKRITGLPVNPHDGKAFSDYLAQKEKEINDVVVLQERLVHTLIERMGNLLIGVPKRPQVVGMIGTTGTGKTLMAETLAEKVYGSKRRALVIDGNDYQSGGLSLNTLLGAPNGVISSDKRSGVLCEYLDDPSQGKMGGVIVINEAEKMHPDAWKRLMEFFDKGTISGGDGKVRYANRHMVILTSNRGAKVVFPDNITMWSQSEIDRRVEGLKSKDIAALFRQKTDGKDEFQLPPEVLGRVDEWAIANPGSHEGATEVGLREATKLQKEMKDLYRVNLEITPPVLEHLSLTGFSATDGYRPVAKQIDSYLKVALREARSKWNVSREGTLKFTLVKNQESSEVKIKVTNLDNNEELLVAAPEQKFNNPLQDKEILENLQNMPAKMGKRIIGQEAAVKSVADAVLAKYADVNRRTAVSFAIVGPTGVGKTELGKAIAEALFGSADRVEIIPLGDVNFEGKLNDIFSSPSGYVGHDKIGKFERALMNTPNGGVIVFDEFSNMGGGKPELKEELLKQQFYHILDEGTWTSTVTGKTYDLRNHVFEFTGNDMQEHFSGLNTDKQRIDTYNSYNSKVKIRAALVKNGIPEAFLGRLADVILAKPLLSTEMKDVTEKELKNQIKRVTGQHRNLTVDYDDRFLAEFTRAFFSPDTGGRSVRTALDNRLGALIGAALLETGEVGKDLKGFAFKFHVKDNMTVKPYKSTHTPKREVILGVEVYKDGKKLGYYEKEFTEFAPEIEVPLGKHALNTAYHEAGHAVMNDPQLTGQILDFITIRHSKVRGPDGKLLTALGYASYKPVPGADSNLNYHTLIAQLAKLYAGRVAQELAGLEADTGWSQDLKVMRLLSTEYLTSWGLDNRLIGINFDKKTGEVKMSGEQRKIFDEKQNELLEIARAVAEHGLRERWTLVRAITAELLRTGDINEERANALIVKYENNQKSNAANGRAFIDSFAAWEARQKNIEGLRNLAAEAGQSAKQSKCESWLLSSIKQQTSDSKTKQQGQNKVTAD